MKQPEIGNKIHEDRIQKGMTQKELADFCNIDIRTIQRIESNEVFPRTSTIKLIAETLEIDLHELNGNNHHGAGNLEGFRILFLVTTIIGIINLVDWFFYAPLIPKYEIYNAHEWIYAIINVITSVFFLLWILYDWQIFRKQTA